MGRAICFMFSGGDLKFSSKQKAKLAPIVDFFPKVPTNYLPF